MKKTVTISEVARDKKTRIISEVARGLHARPREETVIISEVARDIRARPRDISMLFYERILDDELCPVVGHRRQIPRSYIPTIERALRERGMLPARGPIRAANPRRCDQRPYIRDPSVDAVFVGGCVETEHSEGRVPTP